MVAERMVEMVKNTPMVWEGNRIELSISVGVGQYESGGSPGDVTKETDRALYAAKQAGKGRVKVFQPAQAI